MVVKKFDHKYEGLFLDFIFYLPFYLFLPQYQFHWLLRLQLVPKSGSVNSINLFLFFKIS